MDLVCESDYFDNIIFVFFGDYNNCIIILLYMLFFQEQLGLESYYVLYMLYVFGLLELCYVKDVVSLVDVMFILVGLLGIEYCNIILGWDI